MSRCIAFGCPNEVVRVYVYKADPRATFGVCAFHGQVIIKWCTDEQVRDYVFPDAALSDNGRGAE